MTDKQIPDTKIPNWAQSRAVSIFAAMAHMELPEMSLYLALQLSLAWHEGFQAGLDRAEGALRRAFEMCPGDKEEPQTCAPAEH